MYTACTHTHTTSASEQVEIFVAAIYIAIPNSWYVVVWLFVLDESQ